MSLAMMYAGAALAPKMLTSGVAGRAAGLDLVILVDEVEQVQLLALVLMQALGLDVEHGVGVDGHALGALQPVGQRLLVVSLHLGEALQHVHVVFVGQQLFQLSGILAEAGADELARSGWSGRGRTPAASGGR